MFYSQTFLARKGPLGTVWCAAHLQHRLKKSHYTSTDIITTVDRIMCPEVPIALRMSGHLLLGVVRIYSKKVEYLFHDCNVALVSLRKAFASSTEVDLPDNARQAPVQSITLPETFDLDALDLDDDNYRDGIPDNHLRNQEDITITDQIPAGGDTYVVITFDDDIMADFSRPKEVSDSGVQPTSSGSEPVDENNLPPIESDVRYQTEACAGSVGTQDPGLNTQAEVNTKTIDFQDPGPSNQTELLHSRLDDHSSPQSIPEIEIMRNGALEFSAGNLPPVSLDQENKATEPNNISLDQVLNEKDIVSPSLEDVLTPGGHYLPFQQNSEPPVSAASKEVPGTSDTCVPFEHSSPKLAIRSTPPAQPPKPRQRKRKQFDEVTVLSNKFMKRTLENSSDLLRKKRRMPCTTLHVWKLSNSVRTEQVFHWPLLTGLCEDICNMFEKDYISAKTHLLVLDEANSEPRFAQSPAPEDIPESGNARSPAPAEVNPEPMEIENLRHDGYQSNPNLHDFMPASTSSTPSHARFLASPFRRDDFTPFSIDSEGLYSVPHAGTTTGVPELDVAASTGTYGSDFGSDFETPRTFSEEQLGMENTRLPDIPELPSPSEAEDLYFLEADNNTPTGTPGSQGVDSLSVRTRAVAQYLKGQSPIAPDSEGPFADLSLNKILEGKARKLCARMFFETLVLKSYGLVEVEQEQPYDDIILRLTSALSKAQI